VTVRFFEPSALFFVRLFLILDLLCIAFCDLETWTIPYETTWPWILVGLILAPIFPELHPAAVEWTTNARWNALIDAAQGLVFGAGLLWLVGFVCLILIGKEGMGSGDMHLTGMIGAFLGWKAAVAVLFIGVFVGSFTGLAKMAWDKRQLKKNPHKKPWQPVFELPEGEPPKPPPAWADAVLSVPVLLLEAFLLYVFTRRCGEPGFAALVSPYSAVIGGVIGVCLFLSWPVRRGQAIPQGEIRVREDGKKEEVLHGNYIPFGPSLALAGLVTAFYDPLLRAAADYWFFRNATRFAYHLIGWPFDGFPPP
jgi:prepilin signal peptidase PulO-like enzyme (type II secretory pathway)